MIAVDDVLYFQAEDKYTKVVTADGEALIRKPIKELFDELDQEAFWQMHRGTIVNLRAIGRVERDWRDQPVIVLKGRDEKLTVSRTFAPPLQGDVAPRRVAAGEAPPCGDRRGERRSRIAGHRGFAVKCGPLPRASDARPATDHRFRVGIALRASRRAVRPPRCATPSPT